MPNSNTLNLLSDSTFGGKLDEQNAILEDIRDNLGGNLAGTIATIETSPAAAAHAVGEYIYYNTKLYKVTVAIALGDTLTVGTNIAETKVMDEIPSVTNSIASGNTDVPTSGAVYQALRENSIRYVVPNATPSITDDIFSSNSGYTENPPIIQSAYLYNNSFRLNYSFLWIKNSAFGIDTTKSAESEFYSKFIINIVSRNSSSSNIPCINSINYSTTYSGYTVLSFGNPSYATYTLMLQ